MNMKRLAFAAMAALSALCADARSVIVDYFYGEDFYQGTANDCVTPYQSMNYTSPVKFKLDLTKVPAGWHVVDWAICTTGDLAARSIDNYTMLGINDATSYTLTDLTSQRVNLAVVFERNGYTVTFDSNGGTGGTMADQEFEWGVAQNLLPNKFRRDGYKFIGWCLDDYSDTVDIEDRALVDSLTDEDGGSVTLYAVWEAGYYTVAFSANGGEGTMDDVQFEYDEPEDLPPNEFTREHHLFDGWNTKANGKGTAYADEDEVVNLTKDLTKVVTLYAQWVPEKYTLKFSANGGEGAMPDQELDYDQERPLNANTFTRPGYVFTNWNRERGGTGEAYADRQKVVNLVGDDGSPVTLYAQWASNGYTVKFDGNSDDVVGSMADTNYVFGTSGKLPANGFTRPGYTFVEWNTEPSGAGDAYADRDTGSRMVTEPDDVVTLYAQWRPNVYYVSFYPHGGEGSMEDQAFEYGVPQSLSKNAFIVEGKEFLGWNTKKSGVDGVSYEDREIVVDLADEDGAVVKLYAQWSANTYSVVFDPNGGETTPDGVVTQEFVYGTAQRLVENEYTRFAYTFTGWNTEPDGTGDSYADRAVGSRITTEEEDVVILYAQWRANTYTVRFDAHGGAGTMADQTVEYGYRQRLTRNAFTRAGYDFLKWTTKRDGSGDAYTDGQQILNLSDDDGDVIVLYAQWGANGYTVRFDKNSEDAVGEMAETNYVFGVASMLPENRFTRYAYTFVEWNTEPDGTGDSYADMGVGSRIATEPGDSVTLYAQWRPNVYFIVFNAHGGAGTMEEMTCDYGVPYRLTRNAFTADGRTFLGWNTKKSGVGGTAYEDNERIVSLTDEDGAVINLYAQWDANTFTVKFNPNGGEEGAEGPMPDQDFIYGSADTLNLNTYTNYAHMFTGWNTEPDGSGDFYADGATGSKVTTEGDDVVTLYAQWRRNVYSVRFMPGAGTGTMPDQEFEVGVAQRLAQNAFTLDGREFKGWTNRVEGTFYVDRQPVKDLSTEEGAVVRLYAVWDANTFTVRYDPNCDDSTGGPMDDDEFAYGTSKRLTENAFERDKYTFTGWNTAPDGSGVAYEDKAMGSLITSIPEDVVTLYAQWRPNMYIVHFDANASGGEEGTMADQEFEHDYAQRLSANAFKRAGYTFVCWNTKRDGDGVRYENRERVTNPCDDDGDMLVLYAQWTNVSYKVAFNPNGGTGTMDPMDFEYGEAKYLTPNTFTFENHQFVEWNTAPDGSGVAYADGGTGSLIPADDAETVTLYAQWRWNIYTVRFMPRGGEGSPYDQEFSYNERKQLEANRFTADGRVFQGWTNRVDGTTYQDREFVSNLTNEDGRVVHLYAMWDANPFTVVFDKNDEAAEGSMDSQEFLYGTAARLNENTFTFSNHTFVAWNTAPDGTGDTYADKAIGSMISSVEGNVVYLYAQWRADAYIVRFNAHGGEGTMADQTFEHDYAQRLTANAFTRPGYAFLGWSDRPDGSGTNLADQATVVNPGKKDGDILVLYAQWGSNSYKVHFDANGGELPDGRTMDDQDFVFGTSTNLAYNVFTRAWWTFDGWNTMPDGSGDAYADGATGSMIVAESGDTVTLYAQWRPNAYSVRFMPRGGTGTMPDQEFEVNSAQRLSQNAFTADGREFLGWVTNRNGQTDNAAGVDYLDRQVVINLATNDGEIVTLYAKWDANTYEVAFDSNSEDAVPDNGTMTNATFTYGTSQRLPTNIYTRTTHKFKEWNTDPDGTGAGYSDGTVGSTITTEDGVTVTLYAIWRPNIYTVLFAPNGGTGEMTPQDFEYDENKRLSGIAFTRPGYVFKEWNTLPIPTEEDPGTVYRNMQSVVNLSTEDGDIVILYAQWTPNEYIVHFDANTDEASGTMENQSFTFGQSQKLTANAFSRVGYMFDGWNTEADGSGETFANGAVGSRMASANGLVTLYAQWTPITYTIAFDANNGSGEVTTQEFTYDVMQRLDRNTFTWDGHIFLGWDSIWGGGGEVFADRAWVENLTDEDGDIITLYAQWDDASFTVVFYPNGGSGIMRAQEFAYGSGQPLSSNTFTRTGYTFRVWNTEADGSGRTYTDGAIGSGITTRKGEIVGLYAQWRPNTYIVRFDKNSPAVTGTMSDQLFTYGEEQPLADCAFTGRIFTGWNTRADGRGTAYAAGERVSDLTADDGAVVTLYAQWRDLAFAVRFDANCDDATGSTDDQTYEYGVSQRLAENGYEREGYRFTGWNTEPDGSGVGYDNRGEYSRSASDPVGDDGVTLYAQWQGVAYKVRFDKADGAATGLMDDMELVYGQPTNLTANAFALEDCVFVEWTNAVTGATNDDCAAVLNLTNQEDSVVTLCAVWAATNDIAYTIAFDPNGGVGAMPSIADVGYGEEVVLPDCGFTKANFAFAGWIMDDGTELENGATVSSLTAKTGTTVTLRAKWADKVFYVEFDPGDADGAVVTQTFAFGETKALLANTYSRGDKFVFMGWSTNRSENVADFYDRQQVSNLDFDISPDGGDTITLYAQWDDQRDSDLSKAMHCDELEWYLVSLFDDPSPITITDYSNYCARAQGWTNLVEAASGYDLSGSCAQSTGERVGEIMYAEVPTSGEITFRYRNTSAYRYGLVFSYSDTMGELFVDETLGGFMDSLPPTGDDWSEFTARVTFPEGATNLFLHIGFYSEDGVAEIDQVKWTPETPKTGAVRLNSVVARAARLLGTAVAPADDGEYDSEDAQDEVFIPGSGTVKAPAKWKTGQTVTWKAVADKGSSFAHWDGAFVNSLGLSVNELRSPTLKFKVPEDFDPDDIKAEFVSFDSDSLYNIALNGVLRVGVPASGVRLIDDSASYVTATVKGLPSGLKFDAKSLSLTGTPKKSGTYTISVSAKNASGYKYSVKLPLRVLEAEGRLATADRGATDGQAAYHPLTVIVAGDGEGTATGTGVYEDGKKVSVSAKPAKGMVFAGWYVDADLTRPAAFASGDYRKASQTVVMPEIRYLYAKFAKSGALLDPITGLAAAGSSFDAANGVFEWRIGVALPADDGILLTSASLPTCSASGLPAGVKFDATARRFTGVPTKPGEFSARIKVKNAAGATAELPVKVRVSALDAWASGSFSGVAMDGDGFAGVVQSLTVSAAGKLSGKIVMGDVVYTLSAPSYSAYDSEAETYAALVLCKSGKTVVTNAISVAAEKVSAPDGGRSVRGRLDGDSFTAWQNVWKDSAWKSTASAMSKAPERTFELGGHTTLTVSVKFGASGTATAKCLGRSCAAVLVPDVYDPGFYSAYFYFPPKSGEEFGFAVWAELEWDGKTFK